MSQPLNNAAALRRQLMNYLPMRDYDPHANAAKLLAYRLSDELAGNALNLDNLETILTDLCKSAARDRGQKLAARAGLPELENWQRKFKKILAQQAKGGFAAYRKWVESEAVGLVATAHPTFAMTDAMRAHVLAAALGTPKRGKLCACLLYTSPSPRDRTRSRMPSSA